MMDLINFMMLAKVLLTGDATTSFDVTIVDSLLETARTILGMFSVYPLNYYLTAGIVIAVIAIFVRLKRASK